MAEWAWIGTHVELHLAEGEGYQQTLCGLVGIVAPVTPETVKSVPQCRKCLERAT